MIPHTIQHTTETTKLQTNNTTNQKKAHQRALYRDSLFDIAKSEALKNHYKNTVVLLVAL